MKKLIILKGLPASGKSTWAKEQCNLDGNTIRVNKDDIRAMMGGNFSKNKEEIVLEVRDTFVRKGLKEGKTVIVDDTNFHPKHLIDLSNIAIEEKAPFEIKAFDTPYQECIRRDLQRANPVGKKVIMQMYNQYIKKDVPVIEFIQGLEQAIIVDIDGTLAHMTGRSPYDESKVIEDKVDLYIKYLVKLLDRDHVIIIVSGRHVSCIEDTVSWLCKNDIPYRHLYMRKAGDDRKDYIIKKEIYEEHIKDKFNINFVLDDRDQVVQMWREQGLKTLQVAEGDF